MGDGSGEHGQVVSRFGFFPFVRGEQVRLERAASIVSASTGDLSLERSGGQLLLARGDVRIDQGVAQTLLTTGDVVIDTGGALVAAGRSVSVTGGFVGVAAGAEVELHDSRALISGVVPLLASLGLGLVLGAATWSRISKVRRS